MTLSTALALLALVFPSSAARLRSEPIDAIVHAAAVHHVPPSMLLAVCWQESRVGTVRRYASLCGVRLAGHYLADDALSADIAGRSLAHRRAECGTWSRALVSYQLGRGCAALDRDGYARDVLRIAGRLGMR